MAKEPELIPDLQEGEILLIQRSVGKANVVMVVTVKQGSLFKDGIVLQAMLDTWGSTPHADAQIGRQKEAIDRLLRHVQAHCVDPLCEFRDLTKDPCRRTDPHEPHLWYKRIPLGVQGSLPGTEQVREIESHCPGHNPSV